MTDDSSVPVDLSLKRKRDDRVSSKKKSRSQPLDLSSKSSSLHPYPPSSVPFYDPNNLFLNFFLANLHTYCQQPPPTRPRPSQNESFACSCGEKYSNVAQLVSHLKITNHSAQLSSTHDEVAKLVRGQDIWLSRDTNPANQILKCLRCSLSFETLPDLTAHMMKTNHFTPLVPHSSSHSTPKASKSDPPSRSSCLLCSQQFVREVDLVDHLQHLHQIRFNCTTCGMYFENESLYKDHAHHRKGKRTSADDALSLLQNFVRHQTPPISSHVNDENSHLSETSSSSIKSNESPLASLEKMLRPTLS